MQARIFKDGRSGKGNDIGTLHGRQNHTTATIGKCEWKKVTTFSDKTSEHTPTQCLKSKVCSETVPILTKNCTI